MPGPCSAFQSVNNFGNRFYQKEKGCLTLIKAHNMWFKKKILNSESHDLGLLSLYNF